ncbi:HAD family hydrolase [Thiohalorhabdus sp. Cl-TMA]|uniref:HAD family hydrolase n=1 Tax=Thiohalorhabdus methylotrophus TaxID=3242694 RepID=A0ABV4TPU7_9GAMM
MQNLLEAFVFDFDGVIVDSEPAHYRAFQAVLEPRGLGYDWEAYLAHYIGFDDRDGFREAYRLGGQPLPEADLEGLIAEKSTAFERETAAGLPAIPGSAQCVERMAAHLPLAVCSGALRHEIEPTLRGLGIADHFRLVVSAEDVPHSKPDPASYRLAVQGLGASLGTSLQPAACVALEDTPTGVASARDAGLWVIGLDRSDEGRLNRAHRVVRGLEEVDGALLEALVRG